jgi:hypothetical protein
MSGIGRTTIPGFMSMLRARELSIAAPSHAIRHDIGVEHDQRRNERRGQEQSRLRDHLEFRFAGYLRRRLDDR